MIPHLKTLHRLQGSLQFGSLAVMLIIKWRRDVKSKNCEMSAYLCLFYVWTLGVDAFTSALLFSASLNAAFSN